MTDPEIPPLAPLVPIIDQMRQIAHEELPAPRTCEIELFDDGTFTAQIRHSGPEDDTQAIVYERTTSEILWVYRKGGYFESEEFSGGEALYLPAFEEAETEVITTVGPPSL